MFRKHPLRDFMLLLVVGITITFVFNVRAVDPAQQQVFTSMGPSLGQ